MRLLTTLSLLALVAGCAHARGSSSAAGGPAAQPGSQPMSAPTAPSTLAPRTSGAADVHQAALAQSIRSRFASIKACHEAALKNDPGLHGKIVMRFTLLPDGRLADIEVSSNAMPTSAVADCMVAAMSGWRTSSRPSGPVTVEYPFVFARAR